ncbi:calcium-binding protein, partial [Mesorhizobium sp.]|uniref:calcium-binding protein n=1 Tax=Mesorhizobium sp. TaxID=1871066 RepID=UPI0012089443
MAIINGTAQADYLEGTDSNDTISGLGGDDQIDGGFGDDTLDGGDGIDSTTLQFYGQPGINFTLTDGVTVLTSFGTKTLLNFELVTISGTAYADVITGGSGNDTIYGDSIFGGSANDILNGGAGNDYIDGGGGDDTMDGGDGVDSAYLSFQYLSSGVNLTLTDNVTVLTDRGTKSLLNFEAATINGSNYGDVIIGGSGNDFINSGQGNDILNGGAGDDYISNNLGDDSFDGGEGVDSTSLFFGNQSSSINFTLTDNVTVHTDQGTKTLLNFEAVSIYGTNYDDVITGGSGNDYISGGFSGNDILNGGAGDDYLEDRSGDDTLDGGEGVDSTKLQFYDQLGVNFTLTDNVTVHTYEGIKTLLNFEAAQIGGSQYDDVITGGSGNDYITGGSGNDILNGGAGDDFLADRYGNDTLDGGEGIDSTDLDFRNETSGVNFDLESNVAVNTDDGTFTILNIEQAQIQGSQYDDSISGGLGRDWFSGDFGNDTFLGRGGVDYFYGGFGTDTAILLGSRVNYDITTKVDAQGFLNVIARDLRPDNSETGGGEYYHSIEFIQFSDGSLEVETGIF